MTTQAAAAEMGTERMEPSQVLATETLKKTTGPKTSDFYHTQNLPHRFEHPEVFEGYQNKPQNLLYATTNMKYGSIAPSVDTAPQSFHCRTNKFSEHLLKCGMYSDEGLNCSMDTTRVPHNT